MASYELVFRKSVRKDFRSIPKKDVNRILRRIEALRDDPRPHDSVKLSGQQRYRIRQGPYRILYEIVDERLVITVIKIAHRKNIYKGI